MAHSKFRECLLSKAEEYGCTVMIVREDYTSKTCSCCGKIHKKLGSAKTFKCPTCGWTLGRDENGARNILIRHVVESELIQNVRASLSAGAGARVPP